ncbi:MAG: hypothetical protein KAJ03_05360 [Gammaproteobacteria bacterium]|nr:hypothetical protein [Gammaproteobacteria bacterium]
MQLANSEVDLDRRVAWIKVMHGSLLSSHKGDNLKQLIKHYYEDTRRRISESAADD